MSFASTAPSANVNALLQAVHDRRSLSIDEVRRLIRLGADINAVDSNRDTLLHILISRRHWTLLQSLLDGADEFGLDYWLENRDRFAPADFVVFLKAPQLSSANAELSRLHRTVGEAVLRWSDGTRRSIIGMLEQFLVSDCADLVAQYLDGSGPPPVKAAAADDSSTAPLSQVTDHFSWRKPRANG